MMPPGGTAGRASQLATLSLVARDRLLAPATRGALDAAEAAAADLPPDSVAAASCAAVRAAIAHHDRMPAALVARRAELATVGQAVWQKARAESDFAAFAPILTEIVGLERATAEALGWEGHPYNALIGRFEPGETLAGLAPLFAALRAALRPLVDAVEGKPPPRTDFLARHYPVGAQFAAAGRLAARTGYDFGRGRLDPTAHAFATAITRGDVRITARADPHWLPSCLFSALHEAGHGLYEQGVDPALGRGPLATDLIALTAMAGASLGAHESQSRLWENQVGRSRGFWEEAFPELRAAFPDQLADVDAEAFWRAVNRVAPGPVRVEADELTYDFHIMLRVEIEAALIDGSLAVADLPEAWRAAMAEALGVAVPNDASGVLQDVHWASAQIGYFATYTIGNVMAAQLYAVARAEPAVAAGLAAADHRPLGAWMAERIHRHGRRFSRDALLRRAVGNPLDPAPYAAALHEKFAALYDLPPV